MADRVFEMRAALSRAKDRVAYARRERNRFISHMMAGNQGDERKMRKLEEYVALAERDLEHAEDCLDAAMRSEQALLP